MHPLRALSNDMARANPAQAKRMTRRRARVGRGRLLGLDAMVIVVIADVLDPLNAVMPSNTIHAIVWVDEDPAAVLRDVDALVHAETPEGYLVTFEIRRARWWHRAIGRWRELAEPIASRIRAWGMSRI